MDREMVVGKSDKERQRWSTKMQKQQTLRRNLLPLLRYLILK
jgi:hypothetical protein